MPGNEIFRQRHHLDHALIGFARGFAEGDDPVLAENEPVARFVSLENLDRGFGQAETGHEVGHETPAGRETLPRIFLRRAAGRSR